MTISSRWTALLRQMDRRAALTVAGVTFLAALAALAAVAVASVIMAVVPE
ncbi:hypothetical protein AB0M48_05190 [Lentzea sp. NPDC051208]